MVSATADTVNPVSDQCEALGMPCISNFHPWQSYFYGRGGTPDKPFKWTYAHSLGMEDGVVDMIDMWGQVTTNKVVGLLWSNNTDGMAWANEETGMPPALKAAGFTGVQPSMYQPNTDDYTQQISEFKKAGCEIQFGVASGPDFSNFWKQCLQQGYRPKLAGTTKGLGQPKVLDSLGSVGIGLYCEVAWHPTFPFKDSLTGMTCQQLADDYEQASGLQWAPMIGQYAKFEWAVDVLKRTKDLESKEAILTAVVTTKTDTSYGPIDFTSPVKMGTSHPVLNVYKPPYCGGQWRKGTKHAFELFICSNAGGPMVPVQSKIEPMVYS
jgi:branched-chain amino acid transport system substrate-binding protein